MKKFATLFICIVCLLVIISCAKDEQNLSGTISGIVTEYASSNTPIAGATVTINGKGLSKTTGNDGRFEFTGLEPGTYTIAVKANSYQANTKQVTVYAGQKANCDIQLEFEKISVDISPVNLIFDKTVDMLSFTITNQSNRDLTYNIASYVQELEVSPMMGSIKAKGQQAISVKVSNRSSVKKTVNGQIIVNVGGDSYQVNVTVNGTEEQQTTGGVMGIITDYANANAPIAGATVTLASTGESKTTGSDGRYEFNELTPGVYTITVSANDYEGAKKDVNIEAAKTATCDFQLQKGSTNVEVIPQNLTYASDVEQLSFTIKNGSSSTQQYTLSNIPEFVSVSSSTGMISSKGSEAITVTVQNRKQIKERKNAQLKVTVGNDAFIVNITVEPYQSETVNVDITPTTLNFDKDTEQLTFTITSKNNRTLNYEISNDLSIITVSPIKGTLKEKGQNTITVNVQDRQKVDVDRVGKLTVGIEGNTYVVTVNVAKYDVDISLSPQTLSFNNDTEQQIVSIINNNAQKFDYSISSDLSDVLTISPSNGNISGKDKKDITVKVKDRKNISSDKSGLLTVNVGGKTLTANVFISKAQTNASVSPLSLSFDKATDQLSFTITNNNIWANEYSVTSSLNYLTLTPASGSVSAKGQQSIIVKVNDRQSITTDQTGKVTVNVNGTTYNVDVNISKYESTPSGGGDVTRGLQAYYSFNDGTADDSRNGYNGIFNGGTLITDTPNGNGKALYLKSTEYVNIPYAPLNGKKNYSVSFWVKDFGAGYLIKSYDRYAYGPSVQITEGMNLRVYTGYSENSSNYFTFNTSLSNYQSEKWTMVTIVTSTEGTSSTGTSRFYINGKRVNIGTSYTNSNSGAKSMSIGDKSADPLKIDNVRLYSVALTDDEVLNIYNYEK